MSDYSQRAKTTISADVLVTIARMAALGVPGVSRMAPIPGGVNRLFRRGNGDGVRLAVEDNFVYADLYVVLDKDVNIREVSRSIQKTVARAIQEMLAMEVGHVNIHIEEIDFNKVSNEA
jgi:uncharacterized alkaline shock family protein YloU